MPDHQGSGTPHQLTIPGTEPVITVTRRRFSTLIHPTDDPRVGHLICDVVPGNFREMDRVTGDRIVYDSHTNLLLDALRCAGYQVREVAA